MVLRGAVRGCRHRPALRNLFRQTEVQNLCLAALGDENIRWLDVAMDDAFRMGRVERVGNLRGQVQQHMERHRPTADPLLQRLPLQQFHGDEAMAFVFADFVDRADVRMVQRRGRARLAEKTLQGLVVARNLARKKLQRDAAAQSGVFGTVDHTHSSAAQLLDDMVMGYDLA